MRSELGLQKCKEYSKHDQRVKYMFKDVRGIYLEYCSEGIYVYIKKNMQDVCGVSLKCLNFWHISITDSVHRRGGGLE